MRRHSAGMVAQVLPLAAGAAGGALVAALLLGQAWAWGQRHLADWTADRIGGGR